MNPPAWFYGATAIGIPAVFALSCVGVWWIGSGVCADSVAALGFDFDEVLMVCMGLAAAAYVALDFKRERETAAYLIELVGKVERLNTIVGESNPHTLAERVASLESALETFDPSEVRERVATLEARIDHKPITQTRAKGKFVSPQALQDEIDSLRAELAKKAST